MVSLLYIVSYKAITRKHQHVQETRESKNEVAFYGVEASRMMCRLRWEDAERFLNDFVGQSSPGPLLDDPLGSILPMANFPYIRHFDEDTGI